MLNSRASGKNTRLESRLKAESVSITEFRVNAVLQTKRHLRFGLERKHLACHERAARIKRASETLALQSKRLALPAQSKLVLILVLLTAHGVLLTGCRRDMQDQPKSIAYRENSF